MCDLGLALTLGSTLLGAAGQMQQASATAASAKYNQQVANMNATLSDRKAKDAIARGATEEQKKRQEAAQIMGRQQAAMAANGVDITFGSPLDTLVDTSVLGELDALTIRTNANREAYDYKVQAVNQRAGGTLEGMKAKAAIQGGWLGAAGTVLGGASKGYADYSKSKIGAIS